MYTINKVKSLPLFSGCHKRYNIYISLLLLCFFVCFLQFTRHQIPAPLRKSGTCPGERKRGKERRKKKAQKKFSCVSFFFSGGGNNNNKKSEAGDAVHAFSFERKTGRACP